MVNRPHDKVLTHVVDMSGKVSGRQELDEAMNEGYRVIEVICTPAASSVFVTVVLTHDEQETAYAGA